MSCRVSSILRCWLCLPAIFAGLYRSRPTAARADRTGQPRPIFRTDRVRGFRLAHVHPHRDAAGEGDAPGGPALRPQPDRFHHPFGRRAAGRGAKGNRRVPQSGDDRGGPHGGRPARKGRGRRTDVPALPEQVVLAGQHGRRAKHPPRDRPRRANLRRLSPDHAAARRCRPAAAAGLARLAARVPGRARETWRDGQVPEPGVLHRGQEHGRDRQRFDPARRGHEPTGSAERPLAARAARLGATARRCGSARSATSCERAAFPTARWAAS